MIPQLTKDAIDAFVRHGQIPGHFVTAVLSNNLTQAFQRADESNLAAMFEIVSYCYNRIPVACHGSPEKMNAWMEAKSEGKQ